MLRRSATPLSYATQLTHRFVVITVSPVTFSTVAKAFDEMRDTTVTWVVGYKDEETAYARAEPQGNSDTMVNFEFCAELGRHFVTLLYEFAQEQRQISKTSQVFLRPAGSVITLTISAEFSVVFQLFNKWQHNSVVWEMGPTGKQRAYARAELLPGDPGSTVNIEYRLATQLRILYLVQYDK
jgi:hypothetical protein